MRQNVDEGPKSGAAGSVPMGRTAEERLDPRVVRTRRLLREALMELVAEKDFDSITVQDITDRATLNRATLYLHYDDKYDLLDDVFHTLIGDLTPLPPQQAERTGEFDVEAQVLRIVDHVAQHSHFYRALLGSSGVPTFIDEVRTYIENVVLAWVNVLQPDDRRQRVKSDIVVTYVASACLGVIVWWLDHDMPYDSEQLGEQILRCTFGLPYSLGLETPISGSP